MLEFTAVVQCHGRSEIREPSIDALSRLLIGADIGLGERLHETLARIQAGIRKPTEWQSSTDIRSATLAALVRTIVGE